MKIGIACHAPATMRALRKWISEGTRHQVVWTAGSARQAEDLAATGAADLILLELSLGGDPAAEVTRRMMQTRACPILIVTDNVEANAGAVFDAMGSGAMDVAGMGAPDAETSSKDAQRLIGKIDRLSIVIGEADRKAATTARVLPPNAAGRRLVGIGASAGGPAALATLFSSLPKDFPAAIVIVQHVDAQFAAGLADWLGRNSTLTVKLAEDGDALDEGSVYVAGTADHLVVAPSGHLMHLREPDDHVYRPSIDVFFQSVHRSWRGEFVGVLLTGMGRDGAAGLKALHDRGCHTIAQDEATSALYGMPKAAAMLGAASEILPIERIGPRLAEIVGTKGSRQLVR